MDFVYKVRFKIPERGDLTSLSTGNTAAERSIGNTAAERSDGNLIGERLLHSAGGVTGSSPLGLKIRLSRPVSGASSLALVAMPVFCTVLQSAQSPSGDVKGTRQRQALRWQEQSP